MNDNSYKVLDVDINEILPNRFQPRIQFDEEEILELSDSIKEHGVIQPIVVRTIGDKYEIIAGERRYKASVLAGKDTVPVIIKNLNDRDSAELALIENVQRKNLTPIEEALSYKKILDMGYLTQENLAIKIGKSQSSVANKIRLLNLSDEVQEALLDNKISERHARSLLRLKSNVEQNKILEKIITQRLTVRKTDQEIDELLNENNIKEKEEENIMMENIQETNNIKIQSNAPFDIFGGQSTSETVPEVATMPIIEPTIPEVPVVEASPVTGIQFDANGNVIAAPTTMTQVPEMATMPIIEPIIDSFDFNKETEIKDSNISEMISEPIIITDYDKQYDPIMPNAPIELPDEKIDFKEVISAIRECSNKIEKYGYKIELEEYDLSTLYQVVFKIEK